MMSSFLNCLKSGYNPTLKLVLIETENRWSQEIMKSVVCSNAVTKAQNKRVLVTLNNPTKEVLKLKMPNLAQLVHEEFKEALINLVLVKNLQEKPQPISCWLILLKEALRTDDLNSKEKDIRDHLSKILRSIIFRRRWIFGNLGGNTWG